MPAGKVRSRPPGGWQDTYGKGQTQMAELNDIYSTRLLELAADIPHSEPLVSPDAKATAHSKLCGSTVTVTLKSEDGVITGFGQTVKACLLGQAAAAIVGHNIIGTSFKEFHAIAADMRRMLKEDGPPPAGRWSDLGLLEPVRPYKSRHASTLLIFDAVEKALATIEAGAPAEAT
jgi:NifU-like protein involved in Fe-S cluster formation